MENKKINITSTALEKGIDIAKEFVDKLIMPTIEESGLLLKDRVTLWRFKNQIKMLNKAKIYCEKNNISPKTISLKLLCPILDYSGLEEDEILQDKWAILLSNMVDSEQNIENHVFPYILSQLSTNEFLVLEKVFDEKQIRVYKLNQELEEFQLNRPKLELELNEQIASLEANIKEINENESGSTFDKIWELRTEKAKSERKLNSLKYDEFRLIQKINSPESFPDDSLKEFELSNLIRLGIVKEEKEVYASSQSLEIPNERDEYRSHTNIDFDIDVETTVENILTELGELFVKACKQKADNNK